MHDSAGDTLLTKSFDSLASDAKSKSDCLRLRCCSVEGGEKGGGGGGEGGGGGVTMYY